MEQCELIYGCREMRDHHESGDTASVPHVGQFAGGRDELSNGSSKAKCSCQDRAHMAKRNALGMFHSCICTHYLTH